MQKKQLTRRKFFATSLGCVASAGLAATWPHAAAAQKNSSRETTKQGQVIRRRLGKTGLELPIVSMGAGACNDPRLVHGCFEAGMRLFDTAAYYQFGRNEQLVGSAIKRMKARDEAIIVTKVHAPAQRRGLSPEQSQKKLRDTFEGSLRRLGTDYVDILFVHDVDDPDVVRDTAIQDAMGQIKKEGRARFIGVSTHTRMADVVNAVTESDFYDVVLTAVNFTLADDAELLSAIEKAAAKGVGVIGMKTQAGGARFPVTNPETLRDYSNQTINRAALRWVLRNEHVTTTIPGIATFEHMQENFALASDVEFTAEENAFLGDNRVQLGMGFCRQCRTCLASCPERVEIPDLMRTHMYATQYGDLQLARATLNDIRPGRGLGACATCAGCVARCDHAVDIARRIDDLKLTYA